MESTLVIKVKYGDILRRFNARVVENNQLGINMVGLRTKILSLFNFPPDANFTLKYVDEDGDLVTLVDDDDLHEVMRQHLKFLRIDVNMSNDNGCKSNATSSDNSTCLRSPCVSNPILGCDAAVADVFKSVSLDLASKAASSTPVLAALIDCISKIGQVLTPDSRPHVAAGLSSKDGTSQEVETGNVTGSGATAVALVDLSTPWDNNLFQSTAINTTPVSSPVPGGQGRKGKTPNDDIVNWKGHSCGASTNNATYPGNSSTLASTMASSSSLEFPFAGVHLAYPPSLSPGNLTILPFEGSNRHTEAKHDMLHMVICCDGCGIFPITGPRFKSKVKENYDLCSTCFNEMGNETDYIRLDQPVSSLPPQTLKGLYQSPHWTGSSTLPHNFRTAAMEHARPKLDSKFILDVNVIDGTMMAPSTAFTKIWRMLNNGTIAWPKGAQLVWIGGDKFSDTNLVDLQVPSDLEIPVDGVAMDQELDIAVVFKAPESPGQYISNWRMASPSGERFGQHVWVLIQVDAFLKEPSFDSHQGLNLNVPPQHNGVEEPEITDISFQPIMDDPFLQPHNSNASMEPVKKKFDEQSGQELENNFFINDTAFVGHVPDQRNMKASVSELRDINSQPVKDDLILQPHNSNVSTEPMKQMVDEQSRQELKNNISINDNVIPDQSSREMLKITDINFQPTMDDLFLQPHNSDASIEIVKQKFDDQSGQELEDNFSMNDTTFVGHVVLDHSDVKVSEITDIYSQPITDDLFLQPHNSNAYTKPVKQTADEQSGQELENNFSMNDMTSIGVKVLKITDIHFEHNVDDLFLQPHNSDASAEPVKQKLDEQSGQELATTFVGHVVTDHSGVKVSEMTDINFQPVVDDLFLQPHKPNASTEPVTQMVDEQSVHELENNFPMNDTTFGGHVVPDNGVVKVPEIIDINFQPITDDLFLQPHNSNASAESTKQMVDEQSRQELENNFSKTDMALFGLAVSATPTLAASPCVSCPIKIVSAVPSYPQSAAVDEPLSPVGIDGKFSVEETLLKELEEMGFKEVDFNKEILRMNRYNLDLSLDYLCGVSEWDPILEELKEMGFHDNEINKKPLMENNRSLRGLVMNLINGGKA